jgi:hypothetical protein
VANLLIRLETCSGFRDNARRLSMTQAFNGGPVGPPAMILYEPGQAWKGAAAVKNSCAGMWLAGPPPTLFIIQSDWYYS